MLTAIIPARFGSKRIKKKNIKKFLNKPIIYYSINAAKKSKLFDRIVVSTDSNEIKKYAISLGAECPFLRPKNLSGDLVGTSPVLYHAVNQLKLNDEFFCCIYATAPLLNFKDLIKSFNLVKKSKYDSCYSITNFSFPIQRAITKDKNNLVKFRWKENALVSSNKLKTFFHDAGMFYWIRTKEFKKQKTLYPTNSLGYEISDDKVQDIDTYSDWKIAEAKFKYLKL
tara:strand:+ start:276 stop:953 length:678 start_codon:yes stop_codon:yes gene_type:complete